MNNFLLAKAEGKGRKKRGEGEKKGREKKGDKGMAGGKDGGRV